METGLLQIGIKRGKQLLSGHSIEDDVLKNQHNELLRAAVIIISPEYQNIDTWRSLGEHWPDHIYYKIIELPETERWAIAGALIAAAIDRKQAISEESIQLDHGTFVLST